MIIRTTTEIIVEGDRYINTKYDDNFYGTLTYDEEIFLEEQERDFGFNFPSYY